MTKQKLGGFAVPVKIIASIHKYPKTLVGIAEKTGISERTVRDVTVAMRDMGWIYVKGWKENNKKAASRKYIFGQGEDAEYPGLKPRPEPTINRVEFSTRFLIKFIETISENASTQKEVMARTELSSTSCRSIILLLRAEGLIHISGYWRKGHDGQWAAQYSFGPGVDAERPKAISNSERHRRYKFNLSARSLDRFCVAVRQIEAANEERRAA